MTARSATRVLAVSLLSVGLPTVLWAGGEGAQKPAHVSAAPPLEDKGVETACVDAGSPAGTVSSVSGAAFAQAPGEDPRSLACDDVVRACDRVFTSDGARVALLVDDVYVQLGAATDLTLQSTGANVHLTAGTVRVIDTRTDRDVAHFQLSTPQLRGRGLRGDAEANVGISAGNARTRLCSFGDGLTVATNQAAQTVGGGACIEVVDDTINALADGTPTLGLEGALECRRRFAGLADRFSPVDVAAPPGDPFPFVPPAGPFGRRSCDNPGSGCTGAPPPLPPSSGPVFRDPNPTGACGFPGAPCP